MRKSMLAAGISSLLLILAAIPAAHGAPPKHPGATIVLVFKDGHRQTFNLADIDRIEFPGVAVAANAAPANPQQPARGRFFGKWEVGDGAGSTFYITLKESGEAYRSLGNVHGKWDYVDGEAQIVWSDGSRDAIRKTGEGFQKRWFANGKPFTAAPDNVTEAHNTAPRPI